MVEPATTPIAGPLSIPILNYYYYYLYFLIAGSLLMPILCYYLSSSSIIARPLSMPNIYKHEVVKYVTLALYSRINSPKRLAIIRDILSHKRGNYFCIELFSYNHHHHHDLMASLAFGLWGIWKTTNPAKLGLETL